MENNGFLEISQNAGVRYDQFGYSPLVNAIRANDNDLALHLIENGLLDVDMKDDTGDTALLCAITNNNLTIVTALLNKNANVNAVNVDGTTALFLAVDNGNEEVIKLLIDKGADVNTSCHYENIDGYTPLMLAAKKGNVDIARALLQANANVNASTGIQHAANHSVPYDLSMPYHVFRPSFSGYTALMFAAIKGNIQIVAALIQANANVNASNSDGGTALFLAVDNDNKEIVKLLIDNGADVNTSCHYKHVDGYTPLMLAAKKGNVEIAKALLQANANVNASNSDGRTALFLAIDNDHTEVVKLLIDNSADVNTYCEYEIIGGYTPLMHAATKGNVEIARALLQANANVNASTGLQHATNHSVPHDLNTTYQVLMPKASGYTALMFAAIVGNVEIVAALIQANANVNASHFNGNTALFLAVDKNNKEIVKLLIDNGADVNTSCHYKHVDGYTPLMLAAKNGNVDIVTTLIQASAKVNASDRHGQTALFFAVHKDIVEALIENGADVDVLDVNNNTPLLKAIQNNSVSVVLLLLEKGVDANHVNVKGETALHVALKQQKSSEFVGTITQLLPTRKRVSLGENNSEDNCTAVIKREKEKAIIINALVPRCKDVNVKDNQGRTALFDAVQEELKDSAQILIKAGADGNIKDNKGRTPLFFAAKNKNTDIISLLINAGAKADEKDDNKETALFNAVRFGNMEVIKKLIPARSSLNVRNIYGRTPLFYAFTRNQPLQTALLLLECGAQLDDTDNKGFSVLSFFIEKICSRDDIDFEERLWDEDILEDVVTEILDLFTTKLPTDRIFSSIINVLCISYMAKSNNYSYTGLNISNAIQLAMSYASNRKQRKMLNKFKLSGWSYLSPYDSEEILQMLRLLIELGANPNSVDSQGNTALHYIVQPPYHVISAKSSIQMISLLEEHGARFDIRNHDNQTPLLLGLSAWSDDIKEFGGNDIDMTEEMTTICEYLLKRDGYVDETPRNGESVFHILMRLFRKAMNTFDQKTQEMVLQNLLLILKLFTTPYIIYGRSVNKRNEKLKTPLHLWASIPFKQHSRYGYTLTGIQFERLPKEIFDHLRTCGIQLNDRDIKDRTPLHFCKTWCALKYLVEAGAKPNDVDSKGRTPLLAAAHKGVFKEKENCFFHDFEGEPKLFFQTCAEMGLDLWAQDSDDISIFSLLLSSNSFVLAESLVEIACEQSPSVLEHLLLTLCKDQATHTLWKSSLVGKILKCRKRPQEMDIKQALENCCLNIKQLFERGELQFKKENNDCEPPLKKKRGESSTGKELAIDEGSSVHLDIAFLLRLDGANSESLYADVPPLHAFLTEKIDLNRATLTIPWTSVSHKHKDRLERVARRQNVEFINAYWYHKESIGSGAFGDVFAGISEKDGREVAIKKIIKRKMTRPQDIREIRNLTSLAECAQVVKYFYYDDDDKDFAYIVLELMEGHLDDYFASSSYKSHQSISLCKDLVMGVTYLHNHNPPILHRDLKPGNILYKAHPHLCLKIADFGLSSPLSTTGTTVWGTNAGTRCWIAPEVIRSTSYQHTPKSDIYSCGLLLHYILSPQKHPFSPVDCGNKSRLDVDLKTQYNMMEDTMEGFDATLPGEATHLVKSFLSKEENKRPSADHSLSHPLFWNNKKKMEFLYAVGNQPEIERPVPLFGPLPQVESDIHTRIAIYPAWNDARYTHMPAIFSEMTKPIVRGKAPPRPARKYNTGSAVELIRFIRNAISHVSEATRPPVIRRQILEDTVFLEYFPNLVINVYQIITDHGWDAREEIKHAMSCDEK